MLCVGIRPMSWGGGYNRSIFHESMDMICARGVIITKLEYVLKYIGVESGGLMQTVSCLVARSWKRSNDNPFDNH